MKKMINKLLLTGAVTSIISLISIPFVSRKGNENTPSNAITINNLYDDKSPLFI